MLSGLARHRAAGPQGGAVKQRRITSVVVVAVVAGLAAACGTSGGAGSQAGGAAPAATATGSASAATTASATPAVAPTGRGTFGSADAAVSALEAHGVVISHAAASGSYNIATCEVVQDFDGGWEDANSA